MARFVRTMKDYGAKVAIDDFGAGYTSFRALRDLCVDMVKIDGAFVQNMAHSADDRFFVRTLIDLARHLGLEIVAEWVQDEETARRLAGWGCHYLQGFFSVRPKRPSPGPPPWPSRPSTARHPSGRRRSRPARRPRRRCEDRRVNLWSASALGVGDAVEPASSRRVPSSGRRYRRPWRRGCAAVAVASPGRASPARRARTCGRRARTPPCCCAPGPRARRSGPGGPRRLAPARGDLLGHLLAQLLLVAHQVVDGEFEIARHQRLDAVAVEADQLAQEGDRQQVLAPCSPARR